MSAPLFTKGPWSLSEPPYDSVPWLHIYGPAGLDGSHKHIMHADRPDEEKIANAQLIAAAPSLYAALESLMKYHMGGERGFKGQCCFETDAAIDALKQARGEQA